MTDCLRLGTKLYGESNLRDKNMSGDVWKRIHALPGIFIYLVP